MAVEWTITIEGKNEFGDVCRREMRITKSWESLFDGDIGLSIADGNTTTVYVTHDQIEAMTMADKIVVMKEGVVEQVGEPLDLYDRPANRFVGGFIGSPAMNFTSGRIRKNGFVTDAGWENRDPSLRRPCHALCAAGSDSRRRRGNAPSDRPGRSRA